MEKVVRPLVSAWLTLRLQRECFRRRARRDAPCLRGQCKLARLRVREARRNDAFRPAQLSRAVPPPVGRVLKRGSEGGHGTTSRHRCLLAELVERSSGAASPVCACL
jgi:hypothetical protein